MVTLPGVESPSMVDSGAEVLFQQIVACGEDLETVVSEALMDEVLPGQTACISPCLVQGHGGYAAALEARARTP